MKVRSRPEEEEDEKVVAARRAKEGVDRREMEDVEEALYTPLSSEEGTP